MASSRTSRYLKRKENQEKLAKKLKEQGADVVYGTKPYVPNKKQIFRHGTGRYSNGKDIATKVIVDKDVNNIVNADDIAVGDGKISVNKPGQETENNTIPRIQINYTPGLPRINNPLHKFETQNAVFTLAALTEEEVNFPDTTIMQRPPKWVVAKSAGGSARDTELLEGGAVEFYLDNVNIEAIVHSNSTTGHTQGTTVTFTVHEPFSLGLFLQNLQYQVAGASGALNNPTLPNYLGHPMALILEFAGTTAPDEELTPEDKRMLRKVMPIQLTKVNFGNSNGISTYECEAVALNDLAFADQYATIPYDVTLSGPTVSEILWSGKKSLAKQLNFKHLQHKKVVTGSGQSKQYKVYGADGKIIASGRGSGPQNAGVTQVKSGKDFVFLFPSDSKLTSAEITKGAQDKNDGTTVQHDYDDPDKVTYTLRVNNMFRSLFNEDFAYSPEKGFSGEELFMNEIGLSKMIFKKPEIKADEGKEFADENEDTDKFYDKETKTYQSGSAKIDPTNMTMTFKKGTSIVKIIEEVILNSEYGQNLDQRKRDASPGLINWFKVVPARYMFKDEEHKKKYNVHPEILLYRVIVYTVPDDKFMAPNDTSRIHVLDRFIRKEYNIIYTGKNQDVIDFNVEFNNAFYTAMMNDMGNKTPSNVDNATSSVDSEKSSVDQDTGSSIYENYSINPEVAVEDIQGEGSDRETPELRIARQFNKAILDSDVDLVKINLNIVGDPFYIPQSAFGNFTGASVDSVRKNTTQVKFTDVDGNADFLRGVVLTKINFRTPLDISDQKGDFLFYEEEDKVNQLQRLGEFSGYYYPITVRSSFGGNKFTQEIEMIRQKSQVVEQEESSSENKGALSTSPKDNADDNNSIGLDDLPNNGFIGNGNDYGEGAA